MSFSSIILAGGESSRMGENKALIQISSQPLIKNLVDKLKPISEKIYVVTDNPAEYDFLEDVVFVPDIFPEKKSILEAIYSGLKASESEYNFVCSCDLPYLNTNLVQYLFSLKNQFDIVLPLFNNEPQTLHAFYSKTCLSSIEKVLEKGNKKIIRIFRDLNIKYVPETALVTEDPKLLSFFTIKTYLDYMLCKDY